MSERRTADGHDSEWNGTAKRQADSSVVNAAIAAAGATGVPSTSDRAATFRSHRPLLLPIVILMAALLALAFGLGACSGSEGDDTGTSVGATSTDSTATSDPTTSVAKLTMVGPTDIDVLYSYSELAATPAAGGTLSSDGLAVSVPSGAVASDTNIEVKELARPFHMEQAADTSAEGEAVCVGPVYDFGPEGLAFDKPVTITLPYDGTALPAGVPEDNMRVAYWNGEAWMIVPGLLDTQNNTVTVQLERFDGIVLTTALVIKIAAVVIESGIVVKYIHNKLTDPERINSDAVMNGNAKEWITPQDPTVSYYAEIAEMKTPDGQVAPLSDEAAFGKLLESTTERPYISFPGQGADGSDIDLRSRWSKDPSTNWQKPADYIRKNNLKGDCSDVSNAMVSMLINQGYHAKAVFGYAGDKDHPHVWVEALVNGKPYYVDELGKFSPLNDAELAKAQLIRADASDNRNAMWDDNGQEPYKADWWKATDFAGTYKGTVLPGEVSEIPLVFTVGADGTVEGNASGSYTVEGTTHDWSLSLNGRVPEDGQLTASGTYGLSTSGRLSGSGSWTAELRGQIADGTFTGTLEVDGVGSYPLTATRQ